MPDNDDFADAEILEGDSGQLGTSTVGATKEALEDNHGGVVGGASIWYRWTAPRGGLLTVHTIGSNYDTALAAYQGEALGDLEFIEENDDTSGLHQSMIVFPVRTGEEFFIVIDGFQGRGGNVLLTWFLGSTGAKPANDQLERAIEIGADSGMSIATTINGTTEENEPEHHPDQTGGSVWWKFTPPIDGEVTFTTNAINFLHVLAAYEGAALGGLERLARSSPIDQFDPDDPLAVLPDVDTPASIRFRVEKEKPFFIVVDGVFRNRGIAAIQWLVSVPCDLPAESTDPSPPDNAVGVERSLTLSWSHELAPGGGAGAADGPVEEIIFGEDSRRDRFEVDNSEWDALFDSVVTIVPRTDLIDNGNGSFRLEPLSLGERISFCEDEPFFDQPAPGICSGFLVGPDRVTTAGQCARDGVHCENLAFIFGFHMENENTSVLDFPAENIYFCDGILGRQHDLAGPSWTVVQLDRAVEGRKPLSVRRQGKVADDAELLFIGNPFGLPTKLDDAGRVRENSNDEFFVATVDSTVSSAGSPILDKETLLVEGIVVRGDEDTEGREGCFVSKRCSDDECRGHDVTRSSLFEHLAPPDLATVVFEVWFGTDCNDLELLAETTQTSFTLPNRLGRGAVFCWRIAARNECGKVFSPRFSFVTTAAMDPVFRRGDVNADTTVNLSDGVALLNFLFLQGDAPSCLKAADTDDGGSVNLTDAVFILNHLFLQGPALSEPFEECAVDPTPDDGVTCESFPPCEEEG